VEDHNVFFDPKLHDRDLLLGEVVLEIQIDKLLLLVLEHVVVHGQDHVDGAPLIGVNGLDPLSSWVQYWCTFVVLLSSSMSWRRSKWSNADALIPMVEEDKTEEVKGDNAVAEQELVFSHSGTAENIVEEEEVVFFTR
jgi:hypothetical protein